MRIARGPQNFCCRQRAASRSGSSGAAASVGRMLWPLPARKRNRNPPAQRPIVPTTAQRGDSGDIPVLSILDLRTIRLMLVSRQGAFGGIGFVVAHWDCVPSSLDGLTKKPVINQHHAAPSSPQKFSIPDLTSQFAASAQAESGPHSRAYASRACAPL